MKLHDLKNWTEYWEQLRTALLEPKVDPALLDASLREARAKMPVPVLWLLGKTQSGKTSIIRALTGSEAAEIGNGFQPCTRSARFYDFPTEAPLVRFLDTRGLGEVAYDPADDMQYCEAQAHLLVAVMKVADVHQAAVFDALFAIRRRHPEWPLLLVQTGLHELYPHGSGHIRPWPYAGDPLSEAVPLDLRRAIAAQRAALGTLPGFAPVHWVAVDLTLPEDGFDPPDYGLEALWQAIESLTSLGLQYQLSGDAAVQDLYARTAHQHITGYALAAAGLGALPVVDWVAVSAVQAKLLHSLALLYGQNWDKSTITEFLGLAGAGIASGYLARLLSRTVAKVIPVFGQTVGALWGASSSGATTYALGKAAIYFFARRKDGLNVDADSLRQIYAAELERGASFLKDRLQGKSA
ncbi:MAG: 50S ribosome-binding GTPase [Gammaproteobacteria bacterium]|nr:MAG: 50S ribosome-binding GTPase [Gammaproteobacteria bacterium]